MVLTVSFVISLVTGLSCHHHQQVIACELDPSVGGSGPHDFAVRDRHHSSARQSAPDAKASTASRSQRPWRPRSAPLFGDGTARNVPLIWGWDQRLRLRHINTTGKSARGRISRSQTKYFLRAGLDRKTGGDSPDGH